MFLLVYLFSELGSLCCILRQTQCAGLGHFHCGILWRLAWHGPSTRRKYLLLHFCYVQIAWELDGVEEHFDSACMLVGIVKYSILTSQELLGCGVIVVTFKDQESSELVDCLMFGQDEFVTVEDLAAADTGVATAVGRPVGIPVIDSVANRALGTGI